MRYVIIILYIAAAAAGLNYDLDTDSRVDFNDFAIFANSWQTTYDYNDLAGLGDEWLSGTYTPTRPEVNDVNVSTYTHTTEVITLIGSDDGYPQTPARLKYIITSLPADGNLQDPASGAGVIDAVPYTLSSFGEAVWYSTDSNGIKTFTYKANDSGTDPNTSGDSNSATVTIDVNVHPANYLSFDETGYVTIPDDPNLDFVDGRVLAFFLKTRKPFATLMTKRQTDAQGYTVYLVSGKPKLSLYDSNGTEVFSVRSDYRVDDGQWHQVSITSPNDVNYMMIYVEDDSGGAGYLTTFSDANITDFNFANDANLSIGPNYKWEMDNLRFYVGFSTMQMVLGPVTEGDARQDPGRLGIVAGSGGFLVRPADYRWLCDEGSGTTITDDKNGGVVGTISDSNSVKFIPHDYMFSDTSVQQFHRRRR